MIIAAAFNGLDILRRFDDADGRTVAADITANRAGVLRRQVEADRAKIHILLGIADGIDEFIDTAVGLLNDIIGQLAGRLDTDAGKAAELLGQLI